MVASEDKGLKTSICKSQLQQKASNIIMRTNKTHSCNYNDWYICSVHYCSTGCRVFQQGCKIRNTFAYESTNPKEIIEF